MSNREIVRAWKDPEYRATLGGAVPDHPAGQIHFAYPGLDRNDGMGPLNITYGCSTHHPSHDLCCSG